jgi:formylmethanofuran dehydrogenase subunit D
MAQKRTRLRTIRRNVRHLGLPLIALAFLTATPLVSWAAKIPDHFRTTATADIEGGLRCVVGRVTKDGFNQRAYVYLEEAATHTLRWATPIALLPNFYENRASHCLAEGNKVYALIQSDSDSVPVVSQTFVSVVALDQATGHIDSNELVKLPVVKGAVTVFVYDSPENFRSEGDKIVVKGEYGFKGDAEDTRTPFTASVSMQPSR